MTQARINWKTAFANLCDSLALTGKDRDVIESMRQHWQSGKSMTAGRKRYFLQIQERTERIAEAMRERAENDGETEMGKRLFDLGIKMGDGSSWDHGYVESLAIQEVQRGTLSARQIEILEKIESKWTDDKIDARTTFACDYKSNKDDMKVNFGRMMVYYRANPPYFRSEVAKWECAPDAFVPSCDTYSKVVSSKYAQKVLEGYSSTPKYAVGTSVVRRARLRSHIGILNKGGMVLSTTEPIVSAAAGCKRYKVLPYDSTEPVMLEERDVKLFRRPKTS